MAGRLSDTISNAILDCMFGTGAAAASPAKATYYFGLSTTTPTNTGANVTEPSAGAYARVAKTNNDTNFPAAVSRVKTNGTDITFPAATGSWGTLTNFVIYDSTTGGVFVGYGSLASPVSVTGGNIANFPVGSLAINAPGT